MTTGNKKGYHLKSEISAHRNIAKELFKTTFLSQKIFLEGFQILPSNYQHAYHQGTTEMNEKTLDDLSEHCLRPITVTVKAAVLSLPSLHKSGTCFEHPCTSQKAIVLHPPPFQGALPGHEALNWRVHFYQKPTKHKEKKMWSFIQSCQVDEGNQKAPQHNVIHLVLPSHNSSNSLFLWPTRKFKEEIWSTIQSLHVPQPQNVHRSAKITEAERYGFDSSHDFKHRHRRAVKLVTTKTKKSLSWWERDMYQLNTESSHPKLEPHLRILHGLLAQHLSFWEFDLKFRNFQKQSIKWTCFIKVSQLWRKMRILKLASQSKESWLLYVLTKENPTITTLFPYSMKGCCLICLQMLHTVMQKLLEEFLQRNSTKFYKVLQSSLSVNEKASEQMCIYKFKPPFCRITLLFLVILDKQTTDI